MKYTVTGRQMKEIDRDTIERIGIPSLVLMERAALAVADAAEAILKNGGDSFAAICGTGNNGADGIAAGRILWGRGYRVTIFLAGNPEHGTEEYRLQREIAERLEIPVKPASELEPGGFQVALDALFGIGLGRNVEGEYRDVIEKITAVRDLDVVAVDIPSGICADTGAVMGVALKAAVTVTFGYLKSGLLLYPGKEYAGKVMVSDIGFSDCSLKRAGWDAMVLEPEDIKALPGRPADSNKGTFGKLLLVAGCGGMCGAAYLSALAAYRIGTGLVRILTVRENQTVLQTLLPEAIVDVLEPEETATRDFAGWEKVQRLCRWADAIVAGPGLGQAPYVEKLAEAVLSCAKVPVVLDADGINAAARFPGLISYFEDRVVVTPHMGEMARLSGQEISRLKEDRIRAAREYAVRTRAVCVLKDSSSVVAEPDGRVYINDSGCSAMAKAGSGDVLSGVIGGLLAQGMERMEAAVYGTFIHGRAGELAAEKMGERAVLAGELADMLGKDGRKE